jgi:hypothetical protein
MLSSLLIVDSTTKGARLRKISWYNYEGVSKANIKDLSEDNSDNWIDLSRIVISKVLRLWLGLKTTSVTGGWD